MQVVALAGGIGASKLLVGLNHAMDPRELTIVVNTGDDVVMHGLAISPDLDIVTYSLADVVNPETGWGFRDETFHAHARLGKFGRPVWFNLGDRDLATHIHRSAMLREGATLSQVADSIRTAFGVEARILPMSDQPVPTVVETAEGRLHFQEYLVQRRTEPIVRNLVFDGVEHATPAPGVLDAIDRAEGIVVCPSNPLISIGPILAVAGIRDALRRRRDRVAAVCPIVGGKSLKGPSDKMLLQLGFDPSCYGVAQLYQDICGIFLIDSADAAEAPKIESLGIKAVICPTVMRTFEDKQRLAREVLQVFGKTAAGSA